MHARCRCTIVAYDGLQYGTRAARDFGDSLKGKSADFEGGESGGKKIKTPFGEVNGTKVKIKLSDGEVVDHYRRVPADMSYRDWKAVYIDKTKTFETWQAEFDARRQADENSALRQRGRQVIDDLSAGRLPTTASGGKVATDALTAVPSRGNVVVLTSPPQTVGKCKTFDELKMYWAENYNVKVDDSIAKLHFCSVQAAMNGVEAVLKEFPPVMRFLKEFSTRSEGLMTTVRGRGIINFNPECFSEERKLLATLASGVKSGFYIKNANPLSAGAHEAGHIIENWLIDKYGGNVLDAQEIKRREQARRIVRRAFSIAKKIPEGTGKTISQLKVEISLNANDMKISECLASAVADYMTNEQNSALLSQCVWRVLKEELI